ncbi:hypothetical protein FA15DRAFT_756742 [Coprinopsis marcescibilis]|uniref:UBX domain-containing protein n=1 Tax=Coprinopsis marcescibilis TaxID=230819 RepID=A0A5C3KTX6_COPMA|nr:hypothetical protein FA15DRAFT_756742 [Coprinopsis marcescibilis]
MNDLSSTQEAAVAQLRELTNGGDDEVAISVLRTVEWDVQRAADMIFGNVASSSNRANVTTQVEEFEIDDLEQDDSPRRSQPPASSSFLALMTRPVLTVLSFPLHLISSIFRFIFGVLRIPFPRFHGLNFYSPLRPRPQYRGGADRWLRELEEETGAISIGRVKAPKGVSSGTEAGPSTLSSRGTTSAGDPVDENRLLLPDFVSGTYEEALKICQRDFRVGCIILVSEEHDDVAQFKRTTLTDPAFVKSLHENNVLVWGGDVRDREAWSAAEKLQATTYPFVAFVALQPRRSFGAGASSRSSAPPTLTVLSRHQGKSTPASGPTSPQTLLQHLETQVLPRVSAFLDRLRGQQRERERDREIRDEQDRAFRDAARRDTERIQAKIEAERLQKEAERHAEGLRREEEAMLRAEEEIREQQREHRMNWRRWTRRAFEAKLGQGSKSLRVAIRLPNGERSIQQFSPDHTLTTLYAVVDSCLIPGEYSRSEDPDSAPEGSGDIEALLEAHVRKLHDPSKYWGFRIASSYPRVEIPWEGGVQLSTISHLKGGGQVVVELVDTRISNGHSGHDSDDGYDTEED